MDELSEESARQNLQQDESEPEEQELAMEEDDDDDDTKAVVFTPGNEINMVEEDTSLIVMKKESSSGIWKYFGYRLTQGILADQDKPTCVLCKTDVTFQDGKFDDMVEHLRVAHPEYTICEQPEGGMSIAPPGEKYRPVPAALLKDYQFPVWMFFDHNADATCRLCKRICTAKKRGDRSQLVSHLALQHTKYYTSCHKMQMRGLQQGFLLKTSAKSPAWIWFGYRANQYGRPQDKNVATCFLCEIEICSKASSTSGLLRHLESYHLDEYRICEEIQAPACSSDADDGQSLPEELMIDNATLLPKKNGSSLVWKYYGFHPNPDEGMELIPLHKDMPTCRLCMKDIKGARRSTSNLFQHLKRHHPQQYKICVGRAESKSGATIPKPINKSPVWMFFDQRASSGKGRKQTICNVCDKDFPPRKSSPNHLINHLKNIHPEEHLIYQQVKDQASGKQKPPPTVTIEIESNENPIPKEEVVAKLLWKKKCTSPVWDYFGYHPNPRPGWQHEPLNKGIPTCRLCLTDLRAGRSTSNLYKHLQGRHPEEFKICMDRKLAGVKEQRESPSKDNKDTKDLDNSKDTKDLHDSTSRNHGKSAVDSAPISSGKSTVWIFFGLEKSMDSDKAMIDSDVAKCLICKTKCVAQRGNTSSLLNHLESHHPEEYSICQEEISKHGRRDTPRGSIPESNGQDISTLLHNKRSTSAVWKLFGFRQNLKPGCANLPLNVNTPTCRLCRKDVNYKGILAMLFQHICMEHKEGVTIRRRVSEDAKNSNKQQTPSEGNNDSPTLDSSRNPSTSEQQMKSLRTLPSSQQVKLYTCHRCQKILDNSTVINDEKAGVQTSDGETDHDHCWDCYAALPGFSFTNIVESDKSYNKSTVIGQVTDIAVADVSETIPENSDKSSCQSTPMESKQLVRSKTEEEDDSVESVHDEGVGSTPGNVDGTCVESELIENEGSDSTTETTDDDDKKCCLCKYEKTDALKVGNIDSKGQSSTVEMDDDDGVETVVSKLGNADSKDQKSTELDNNGADIETHRDTGEVEKSLVKSKNSSKSTSTAGKSIDIAVKMVVTDNHTLEESSKNTRKTWKPSGTYYCKKCDKAFLTDYSMQRHKRNVHKGDKLICCVCSKKFSWQSSLREHERIHFGDTPFKCQSCGKGFVSRMKMVRHAIIHTGEKPFLCTTCGRGFNQKCTLQAHERKHNGVKPYECNVCGKRFIQNSNRLQHQRKHDDFRWNSLNRVPKYRPNTVFKEEV